MTTDHATGPDRELLGQTVVVIGGSSGIGLETARRARAEGADVVLTGRHSDSLQRAAIDLGALSTAAFDGNDPAELERFFAGLPKVSKGIDHVMVTAGAPRYGRLLEMKFDELRHALGDRLLLAIEVARNAAVRVRPRGTLLFMTAEGGQPSVGIGSVSAVAAALPALVASLALELAPVRVNLIAAGFVDTPLSASLVGSDLQHRRRPATRLGLASKAREGAVRNHPTRRVDRGPRRRVARGRTAAAARADHCSLCRTSPISVARSHRAPRLSRNSYRKALAWAARRSAYDDLSGRPGALIEWPDPARARRDYG